ncbi:MAG: porin family protein [bacterium]|nr:porin family protein [bacterium]
MSFHGRTAAALISCALFVAQNSAAYTEEEIERAQADLRSMYSVKKVIFSAQVETLRTGTAARALQPSIQERLTKALARYESDPARRSQLAGWAMANVKRLDADTAEFRTWLAQRVPGISPSEVQGRLGAVAAFHGGRLPESRLARAYAALAEEKPGPPTAAELVLETALEGAVVASWLKTELARQAKEKKDAEAKRRGEEPDTLIGELRSNGIHMRRSPTEKQDGKPATFSLNRSAGQSTVYSTDVAIIWGEFFEGKKANHSPSASLDVHISSDDTASENALRLQGGWLSSWDAPFYTSAMLKYETDRDFDTRKATLELQGTFVPDGPDVACIHVYCWNDEELPVAFRWEPWIGTEAGYSFADGDSNETDDGILRLLGRLRADVRLTFLQKPLRMKKVSLFAEETFRYLPLERGDSTYQFLTAGLTFELDDHVSLGLTYKNGEDAPNFEDIDTFGLALGLKF